MLTLITLAAGNASAQELALPQLQAQVGTLVSRWEDAERTLARTRNEQATLEHRIAALKRLETNRPLSGTSELDNLLRDSVQADASLRRDLAIEAERRRAAVEGIKGAVGRIDQEIRRLVPALKSGTIEARTKAARRLAALKDARDDLRLELASLKDNEGTRKAWARYEVAIEPLDGPSELNEKADFVEDTRDKIQEKRSALAALIREAQEEQQLAQAARDFATDVTIFDEESRTGRVQRRGGGATGALADRSNNTAAFENNEQVPATPVSAAPPPEGEAPPARGNSDPVDGFSDSLGAVGQPTTPPPATPPPTNNVNPGPTTAATNNVAAALPISKDLNPSVLLSLRIEELAAKGVDLATLERLVTELQRLDGHLAQQAKQIRARAKQLEVDEAKALGRTR